VRHFTTFVLLVVSSGLPSLRADTLSSSNNKFVSAMADAHISVDTYADSYNVFSFRSGYGNALEGFSLTVPRVNVPINSSIISATLSIQIPVWYFGSGFYFQSSGPVDNQSAWYLPYYSERRIRTRRRRILQLS
jgi:hypothetical protein